MLKLGLISGRHDLPVEDYVFNVIKDVTDIDTLEEEAYQKLKELCGQPHDGHVAPAAYREHADARFVNNGTPVVVYATGLSVALIAVINAARALGVHDLTVMHYDACQKAYFAQKIVW